MHDPLKLELLCAALVLGAVALAPDARACTCVDWPADRRMKEADQVFIGKAGQRRLEGAEDVQPFVVYQTLKGEVPHKYELRRPQDAACERSFQNEELAIVFVVKGRAPICNGNVDIDKLMTTLGDYLNYEGQGQPDVTIDAVKVALAGHLGDPPALSVVGPPSLAKRSVQVGPTKLSFVATPAPHPTGKGAPKVPAPRSNDDLPRLSATTRGALTFVSLFRPGGNHVFSLLRREGGKLTVLAAIERGSNLK